VQYIMGLMAGEERSPFKRLRSLFVMVRNGIPLQMKIEAVANPRQIQKSAVKNRDDNPRPRDVVRGFSLVPGRVA